MFRKVAHPMDAYTFSLALGAVGLAVMGLRAVGQGHDTAHPGDSGHGHAAGPTHHDVAVSHGPAHGAAHGPAHVHQHDHAHGKSGWDFVSPRVWFSVLVGAGATGLLLKPFLFEPLIAALAIVGGLAFERFLVSPIWHFLLRFESRPAMLLESLVLEEARAETDFDASGEGLVGVELDGQNVQLLGRLTPDELKGERVRRGARLRIEEVDPARNRCLVSRWQEITSGENP